MRWNWSAVLVFAFAALFVLPGLAKEPGASFPVSVDHVLDDWEEASRGRLGVGSMELRRLHEFYNESYSAHELAVLNKFRGPVSSADLKSQFAWTIEKKTKPIVLTGRPTDPVEQMFYKQVDVTLDPDTRLPKSVQFHSPRRKDNKETLAVVPGVRFSEPNLFQPDEKPRPLTFASKTVPPWNRRGPVRVVEHVTLLPVPEGNVPDDGSAEILKAWQAASQDLRFFIAKLDRRVFENGGQIEHRATGELNYIHSQTLRCTISPMKISANTTSQRESPAGVPYELLPSPTEHWEYTRKEIRFLANPKADLVIFPQETAVGVKQAAYEVGQKKSKHTDIIIPPWRMMFAGSMEQLTDRFEIRRNPFHPAALDFRPKRHDDVGGFHLMQVELDEKTSLPKVVRFFANSAESVYTLNYTQIHQREPAAQPNLLPIRGEPAKLLPAPTEIHGNP